MRLIIISILILVYLLFDAVDLLRMNLAVQMLLHHFFHANVFHLAANCLCVWCLFRRWNTREMFESYVIASLSILVSNMPVLGFSNIIYALVGLRSPAFGSSWWIQPSTLIFIGVTLTGVLIPGISAITHVVSFVSGILVSVLSRFIKQVRNDSARYI